MSTVEGSEMNYYTEDELNDLKTFGEYIGWKDLHGGRGDELMEYFKKLGSRRSRRALEQRYTRELVKRHAPKKVATAPPAQKQKQKQILPLKRIELSAVKASPIDNALLDLIDCVDVLRNENLKLKEENERLKKEVEKFCEVVNQVVKN